MDEARVMQTLQSFYHKGENLAGLLKTENFVRLLGLNADDISPITVLADHVFKILIFFCRVELHHVR
jgi:hypothetical protein